MVVTEADRVRICEHECAHAITAMHFGFPVSRVAGGWDRDNHVKYDGGGDDCLVVVAAGIAWSGLLDPGVISDVMTIVKELGLEEAGSDTQMAAIYPLMDRAARIIRRHRGVFEEMSERLVASGVLESGELAYFARRVEESRG